MRESELGPRGLSLTYKDKRRDTFNALTLRRFVRVVQLAAAAECARAMQMSDMRQMIQLLRSGSLSAPHQHFLLKLCSTPRIKHRRNRDQIFGRVCLKRTTLVASVHQNHLQKTPEADARPSILQQQQRNSFQQNLNCQSFCFRQV